MRLVERNKERGAGPGMIYRRSRRSRCPRRTVGLFPRLLHLAKKHGIAIRATHACLLASSIFIQPPATSSTYVQKRKEKNKYCSTRTRKLFVVSRVYYFCTDSEHAFLSHATGASSKGVSAQSPATVSLRYRHFPGAHSGVGLS